MSADDILYGRITGTIDERVRIYEAIRTHGGYTKNGEIEILRIYRAICRRAGECALNDAVAVQVLRYCRDYPAV